ncbi:MAG: hypothetical protein ACE5I9_09820 [Candidatus Methylomirabilales bacterium]
MPEKSLLKAKRDIRKRRVASAEEHLRKALAELPHLLAETQIRHCEECVTVACELARIQARAGNLSEADRLLTFALEIGRAGNVVERCIEVYRLRALLSAHFCRFSEAFVHCESASALIQEAGLEPVLGEELQATAGLIQRVQEDAVAAVKLPPVYVDSLTWETRFLHNDLYLPKALADAAAAVSDLTVRHHDLFTWQVELCVRYEANASLTEPYRGEGWKRAQAKLMGRDPTDLPGLTLGLGQEEEVVAVEVRGAQGELLPASADTRSWTIFLPDSYPRLGELPLVHLVGEVKGDVLPLCKRYRYLLGKGAVVSWAVAAGVTYRLRVLVEAYPRDGELGKGRGLRRHLSLLVPAGKVQFGEVHISAPDLAEEEPRLEVRRPFEGETILEADEVILHQLFRGSTPTIQVSPESLPVRQPLSGERLLREGGLEEPVELEDFSLLVLSFTLCSSDPIAMAVRPLRSSLPVAVYPHLRMLEGWKGFGVLVYHLANFGDRPERLRLSTELPGRSRPQVEEVTLSPRCIRRVRHAPELLPGPEGATPAVLRWEVLRVRDGVVLDAGSVPIQLLDRSRLPRILISPEDGRRRDLTPFVAAYVMPGDGVIQQVITEAARYLPGEPPVKMEGYPPVGTADERSRTAHAQVEALFCSLKEARGLRCTGEDLAWGMRRGWEEQPLRVPRETLETGKGNCLDLSLLMASCLEHLGLRPWTCLTPGHAFVGFEPLEDRDEVVFLETAFLDAGVPGGYPEALQEGQRLFQTEFDRGVPGRTWCRGISLTEARNRWQIAPWEA